MKHLYRYFFLFFPLVTFSQKMPEIEAINRVILNHKDSIIYAHLLPEEDGKKVTASDNYWYHWYAQHDIKETRGGFDGKLLHGNYTEYYESKDLKKKGVFKKGLKKGKWKSWYKNGQLSEIVYYKNGVKHGKFTSFRPDGTIALKGRYNKGVLVVRKAKKPTIKQVVDSTSTKSKWKSKNKKPKEKKGDVSAPPEVPKEKGKKEKKPKKGKEPKIKIRRSIKIVTPEGKST